MEGVVNAVWVSEKKGTEKDSADSVLLTVNHLIDGDSHADPWHRQVSLPSFDKVEEFNRRGAQVTDGAFGENLPVRGIDLRTLAMSTVFTTNGMLFRIPKAASILVGIDSDSQEKSGRFLSKASEGACPASLPVETASLQPGAASV